jgi:cell division protein FtsQ
MTLFLLVTVVAGIAANSWKQNLVVGEVVVRGNAIVDTDDIVSRAGVKTGAPLYDVDLGTVQRNVLGNRVIRSVAVNRELPDRIVITIEERSPIAALALGTLIYLDETGYMLPPVRSATVVDLPLLTGEIGEADLTPGKSMRSTAVREMLAIVMMAHATSEDLARNISEIHRTGEGEMVVYTAEFGVPVIFGKGETAAKLVKLDGFWKSIVQPVGGQRLQYVDLRFSDQVVCRWKPDGSVSGGGAVQTGGHAMLVSAMR